MLAVLVLLPVGVDSETVDPELEVKIVEVLPVEPVRTIFQS